VRGGYGPRGVEGTDIGPFFELKRNPLAVIGASPLSRPRMLTPEWDSLWKEEAEEPEEEPGTQEFFAAPSLLTRFRLELMPSLACGRCGVTPTSLFDFDREAAADI